MLTLIDFGNDYFLAKFSNREDSFFVLEDWMIADHYLTIQKWRPDFDPEEEDIRRVAVWVRFPGLPIEYYDELFLCRLGDRIGKTIQVDTTTALAD